MYINIKSLCVKLLTLRSNSSIVQHTLVILIILDNSIGANKELQVLSLNEN